MLKMNLKGSSYRLKGKETLTGQTGRYATPGEK
jgi:hypothetical protein